MITYEMVKRAMVNPPQKDLVDLYNELGAYVTEHNHCINDDNPFQKLDKIGSFCISATSIQSSYIAFVLGKHSDSIFPEDVINKFFNIPSDYNVQFGNITGKQIDGCICLIHLEDKPYDLQMIYDKIYN
ncbi:MAG: hypothetical protein ACI8YQ_004972 [Polaribacter sp.]|jgi:hypothetical protein